MRVDRPSSMSRNLVGEPGFSYGVSGLNPFVVGGVQDTAALPETGVARTFVGTRGT